MAHGARVDVTLARLDVGGRHPLMEVTGPAGFSRLGEAGVDGVIWRRPIPASVQDWIDALPADALPSARVVLGSGDVRRVVIDILDTSGAPAGVQRQWLANDVVRLARAFAQTLAAPYLRLRFDVVADDGCPKFHRDAVTARLLCTYRGLGTQYGPAIDGAAPAAILTAPTGAPIILRGTQWPGRQRRDALRHRSPPIAHSHAPRLVLVLDPVTEPPSGFGQGDCATSPGCLACG